jgi:hypothetical protein
VKLQESTKEVRRAKRMKRIAEQGKDTGYGAGQF